MKIRPAGIELFHAETDRQTDRYDEANSRFSQFCERPKKSEIREETSSKFCGRCYIIVVWLRNLEEAVVGGEVKATKILSLGIE